MNLCSVEREKIPKTKGAERFRAIEGRNSNFKLPNLRGSFNFHRFILNRVRTRARVKSLIRDRAIVIRLYKAVY